MRMIETEAKNSLLRLLQPLDNQQLRIFTPKKCG
jgi:hypothetical protein